MKADLLILSGIALAVAAAATVSVGAALLAAAAACLLLGLAPYARGRTHR